MSQYVGFRCPDEICSTIDAQVKDLGVSKTTAILSMLSGLPSVSVTNLSSLPTCEAIYFVFNDKELLYIGQSSNLARRLKAHHRRYEFIANKARLCWFSSEGSPRLEIESELIKYFKPPINNTGGDKVIKVVWG
jgi:hypothetical protein